MRVDESKKILGYYDYTVILTYLGFLCAFTAIIYSINGSFLKAVILLMFSGLCDMFDGTVAATKCRSTREKQFGIQIDSLSDLVSFGVMPAVFVYIISGKNIIAGVVASFYVMAALIRLTNISESIICGLIVEIILTFIYVFIILGVTSKKSRHGSFVGLIIGLSLTLVHILGIKLTGTSVNPARSLGPALFSGSESLTCLWVFIAGPFAGAALASVLYNYLEGKSNDKDSA